MSSIIKVSRKMEYRNFEVCLLLEYPIGLEPLNFGVLPTSGGGGANPPLV